MNCAVSSFVSSEDSTWNETPLKTSELMLWRVETFLTLDFVLRFPRKLDASWNEASS